MNKQDPIYAITVGRLYQSTTRRQFFEREDGSYGCKKAKVDPYWVEDDRTFGFYHTFEEAEDVLLNNKGDIHEMDYSIACITEMKPGLYTNRQKGTKGKTWYLWCSDSGEWDDSWTDEGQYIKQDEEPEIMARHFKQIIGYWQPF